MTRAFFKISALAVAAMFALAGCTTVPVGPSVAVYPGTGKPFDNFRGDDYTCRQFASEQIGGANAVKAGNDDAMRSGAIGTLLGAAVGAAMGGRDGAAVGAGAGLLMGSASGAGTTQYSSYGLQRRYDIAYQQCMYAKGNLVPSVGAMRMAPGPSSYSNVPPPPPPSRY